MTNADDALAFLRSVERVGPSKRDIRALLPMLVQSLIQIVDHLSIQGVDMAKSVAEFAAEFQAASAKLTAEVAEQKSVVASVKVLIQGQAAQIAALKAQLEEAIAAGGDATVLQPILDSVTAQLQALSDSTDDAAAAVVANT